MSGGSGNQPSWVAEMDAVLWEQVEHAYGPATNVPEMIRKVVWSSEAEALETFGELSNNLNHQGSIYPATGPALPFLIHALRHTEAGPRIRAALLGLLGGIAREAAAGWDQGSASQKSHDPGLDPWEGAFQEILANVWQGVDLFVRLLQGDPDADVRMHAAHVLGVLAGWGPAYVPRGLPVGFDGLLEALLGRLEAEKDALALSSVAFALGRVLAYDAKVRTTLRKLLEGRTTHQAVRVAAALVLVEADAEQHEELTAVDVLIETMSRASETDLLFQPRTGEGRDYTRWSPWVWGKLRFRIGTTLCAWSAGDEGRMQRVLPALLVGVRSATGYTAATDIGPILGWLWPGREIRMTRTQEGKWDRQLPPAVTAEELKGARHAVVQACYENAQIWNPPIGNTDLAFMQVGLPQSRAELGKLLGINRTPAGEPYQG
jgi:hypothetical protein